MRSEVVNEVAAALAPPPPATAPRRPPSSDPDAAAMLRVKEGDQQTSVSGVKSLVFRATQSLRESSSDLLHPD